MSVLKIILVILLMMLGCLIGVGLSAQEFSYSEFKNEKDATRRIEMGIESWNYYLRNNLDSLRLLGAEIMHKDSAILYPIGVRNLGSYYSRTNDIARGIELLLEAREIFSELNMQILLSETENELGNAYFLLGNYNLSSRYYFASIVHGSVTSDVTASYNGMIGFGKTLAAIGDTSKGVLFVQEYLERCLRDEKFESASDACGYLGTIAGLSGKVELMSAYYRRNSIYAGRSDSKTHEANANTNRAIDFFTQEKVDSSLMLFRSALKLRQEVGATRPIVESFYNLAVLNIETGNLMDAKTYAEKGEELSEASGIRSWQLDCLTLLLEVAEKNEDADEVFQLEVDIARIEDELEKFKKLDNDILQLATSLTSLEPKPVRKSYLGELVGIISILMTCLLLLYQGRKLV